MTWLHEIFGHSAELALFLALGIGYLVDKKQFGKFQLGGVAGSLPAALVISPLQPPSCSASPRRPASSFCRAAVSARCTRPGARLSLT